ncbi:probable Peroxiredoxin HYR1 [Zygosaccharomyces bailii]|nr:probable Peroxiredoxin HYR1 [Zygosaccharomyces bailii]
MFVKLYIAPNFLRKAVSAGFTTSAWFSTTQQLRTMSSSKFYSLEPKDKTGQPFPFKQLEGKVVLIVNVASKCGFTPQYAELEDLYKKHKDEGFVILGFPCNQFARQEPGTDEEIAQFCKANYGVTFPILKKIDVNGKNVDPVYEFLKSQKSGALGLTRIKWNFEKFLVDKHGNVYQRYSSLTKPMALENDVKGLLSK